MSLRILTLILILYSLDGILCQVSSDADIFINSEFTKTLLTLADIFENNKTHASYNEAKKLLNSETIDLKVQCRMNRNLYNADVKRKEYEKKLQKMLQKDVKSLSDSDAKDLWNSLESFCQEISNCYPYNFPFGLAKINEIIFNIMSIMAKEIIDRYHFYLKHDLILKNKISGKCELARQDKRKLLFHQELLMQLSPIIGSCIDSIKQRICVLNELKNLGPDLRRMVSPIGPENECKDF